jgi:hypothetical protein
VWVATGSSVGEEGLVVEGDVVFGVVVEGGDAIMASSLSLA